MLHSEANSTKLNNLKNAPFRVNRNHITINCNRMYNHNSDEEETLTSLKDEFVIKKLELQKVVKSEINKYELKLKEAPPFLFCLVVLNQREQVPLMKNQTKETETSRTCTNTTTATIELVNRTDLVRSFQQGTSLVVLMVRPIRNAIVEINYRMFARAVSTPNNPFFLFLM
jgi:hypothetical protein